MNTQKDIDQIATALLANEPFMRTLMRKWLENTSARELYTDPLTGQLRQGKPGLISYGEAATLVGCTRKYIRKLVTELHVPGDSRKSQVHKQELVDWVLANSKMSTRQHLIEALNAEREKLQEPAAPRANTVVPTERFEEVEA